MRLFKLFALSMLLSTPAYAGQPILKGDLVPTDISGADSLVSTNKVYIDQQGTSVNVNIQQTGISNIVGTANDKILLRGDNQTLLVTQSGNSNIVLASIIGNYGAGSGTSVNVSQYGNNNSAVIRCGNGAVDANCNGLNINAQFTGNSNSLNYHGAGQNLQNSMNFSGNYNNISLDITTPNSTQALNFVGDFNTVNAVQNGSGGTYGHALTANFSGSNNTLVTQQSGASETVININSVGSNGQWNIKTGN